MEEQNTSATESRPQNENKNNSRRPQGNRNRRPQSGNRKPQEKDTNGNVQPKEVDGNKAEGGNKAAGTRVRKQMQKIKQASQEVRNRILEIRSEP